MVETPRVSVGTVSNPPGAPAVFGILPVNLGPNTSQGPSPFVVPQPSLAWEESCSHSEVPDPVVQLMQQATSPGVPEEVRQSLYHYAKQLAEEHFRRY